MFSIQITPEAKIAIAERGSEEDFVKPGLMIHRQGARAEIIRTNEGSAKWTIERPHPWQANIVDLEALDDGSIEVIAVDEILVWLIAIPKPTETGVGVSLMAGELVVTDLPK
jgi:hypothetical protein